MKKLIISWVIMVLLSTCVFAGVNRIVSSTNVAPSSTFTVKYTLTGATAPYFYIIRDTISSGGCTFSGTVDPKVLPTTLSNPATSTVDFTVNTPSSTGTCVLSGFYKLGDASNVNFADTTITIREGIVISPSSEKNNAGVYMVIAVIIGIMGWLYFKK